MLFYVSNSIQTFQTDWVESSTQSSLVVYNSCSTEYPVSYQYQIVNKMIIVEIFPITQNLQEEASLLWHSGFWGLS